MHQRLTDTIADAGPAVVGAMRIDGFLPVFRVEGGVADGHNFPVCGGFLPGSIAATVSIRCLRRGVAAAASQQRNDKTGSHNQGKRLFHFIFPFFKCNMWKPVTWPGTNEYYRTLSIKR